MTEEQIKELEEIRKMGIEPYPYKFDRAQFIKEIVEKYSNVKAGEKIEDVKIAVAGRIRSKRRHGKLSFAHIEDSSGRIQVFIGADNVSEKEYKLFSKLNIGDIIGVEGGVIKTIKGELSILVKKLTLLSKALRTLPSQWYGLKDVEMRYRQRYLDLIMNLEIKKTFILRTKIIDTIREFLNQRGFLEVETPLLQPIYGGAEARPFKTHLNALDMDLYLSISPELYLKKLVIGGFERVFTICKNFRNEGIDKFHNPEFTMMECYQAYADYNDIMDLIEEMMSYIAKKVTGNTKVKYQDKIFDFGKWKRISMREIIKEHLGVDIEKTDIEELQKIAKENDLEIENDIGSMISVLFDKLVQPKIIYPTFVIDYPISICPLTKRHRKKPDFVERVEAFINGTEIANAYSELINPIEQEKRLKRQASKKGTEWQKMMDAHLEALKMDKDFITSLEHGCPPLGGVGVGIDRLVMFLTNQPSLRDVIFFPFMKPEKK